MMALFLGISFGLLLSHSLSHSLSLSLTLTFFSLPTLSLSLFESLKKKRFGCSSVPRSPIITMSSMALASLSQWKTSQTTHCIWENFIRNTNIIHNLSTTSCVYCTKNNDPKISLALICCEWFRRRHNFPPNSVDIVLGSVCRWRANIVHNTYHFYDNIEFAHDKPNKMQIIFDHLRCWDGRWHTADPNSR